MIYGRTTPATPEEMRESASFMLAEADLDKVGRQDGGLYAYVDEARQVVIRSAACTTSWAFTSWPAIEAYVEAVHALDEQGVTDAAQLDADRFEAILARLGESAGATPSAAAEKEGR